MDIVCVEILKMIDDSFPMFVECVLLGSNGKKHYFHDKLPVFFSDSHTITFPTKGQIRCQIIQEKEETLIIDTLFPDGIESTQGKHRFEICKNQIYSLNHKVEFDK